MSYSPDFRKRVIEYRREGHTQKETHNVFKVSTVTISAWEKKLREEGTIEKKPLNRQPRKLDSERLKAYIEAHPDAYLREIAAEFNCCETAVTYALRRLKITRKKRQNITRNKTRRR
jgi:transposase